MEIEASVTEAGPVKLWDWDTGKLVKELEAGVGSIESLAWCSAGHRLVVNGESGTVLFRMDGASDKRSSLARIPPRAPLACGRDTIAFVSAENTIEILDADSGLVKRTLKTPIGTVTALALSALEQRLATACEDGAIRLWDVRSGAELSMPSSAKTQTKGKVPRWLAFAGDDRYILAGAPQVGLAIFEVPPGSRLGVLDPSGRPSAAAVVMGNWILLGTGSGLVFQCSIAEIDKAMALGGKATQSNVDGKVLIEGTTPPAVAGAHTGLVWGMIASPDGRYFATGSHDHTVKLWEAATGRLLRTYTGQKNLVWGVAFSPDGRLLAGCGEGVTIWETDTGRLVYRFQDHSRRMVSAVAFHPSGHWLVSAGYDGSVQLRELPSGRYLGQLYSFEGPLHNLTFDPKGHWLALAYTDFQVALWKCGEQPPTSGPPERLLVGHTGAVRSVCFSADGRYLASASERGTIILWDGESFSRIVQLKADTGQIRGLSFSRDGRYLAGAAYDAPAVIWDLQALRQTLGEMDLDW